MRLCIENKLVAAFLVLVLLAFPMSWAAAQENEESEYTELQLIDIKQLSRSYKKRFDLSGIVVKNQETFVVSDKQWDHFIYQIDFKKKK